MGAARSAGREGPLGGFRDRKTRWRDHGNRRPALALPSVWPLPPSGPRGIHDAERPDRPPAARADESDKLTILTFSKGIQLPGKDLPAGRYRLRLSLLPPAGAASRREAIFDMAWAPGAVLDRSIVAVVDEARRVLSYGQQSLIGLVRESRSKGMSVFLISQSPDDYDSVEDNFLENIGLGFCFRTNATSSRVLRAWLGQSVDLASLPDGVAVTRLPGQPAVTRVKAWE